MGQHGTPARRKGRACYTGDRPSTVTRITDGGVTSQGPVRPRLHTKYTGTPVATMLRPIRAWTGRATMVFPTIAAAAAMNSAGVTGYPGTRNGRGASGRRRRSTKTLAAASPANIQLANTTYVNNCSKVPLTASTIDHK